MLRLRQEIAEMQGVTPPVSWYFHGRCHGFHLTSEPA